MRQSKRREEILTELENGAAFMVTHDEAFDDGMRVDLIARPRAPRRSSRPRSYARLRCSQCG